MGVDVRKLSLPAPTESSVLQTSGGSGIEADLATDVSRRTDHTSYSIPEDGSPVTINTKKRRENRNKEREGAVTRGASHPSQTSLLIEYFEGGKGPGVSSRPSVRVKVTPSAAHKIKNTNDHIQLTQSKGSRKPSYTRRISVGPNSSGDQQIIESTDDKSISSYTSAAEESALGHRHPPPLEIEVMHEDEESELSRTSVAREERYTQVNPSDISSMPPDSMLEGKVETMTPPRNRSRSISREAVVAHADTLKTPSRRRSRSLSKERLADKAMEKLTGRPRELNSGKHKHSGKTRSRSISNEQIREKSGRRRSSRQYQEEELASGGESSLLTTSQRSPRRQSGDQQSIRSGTSKSSININPKLLETVENAVNRLIKPELELIRKEQKMQQSRQKFDRSSVTSGSSASRSELSRKLSKHASAPDVSGKPEVVLNRDDYNAGTILSGDSIKGRKESRRSRHSDSPSERRSEREMSEETVIHDGGQASRKKSRDGHRLRDAAAGGIAGGILTAAALNHHDLKHHDSETSIGRKERRRRRSSKSHSRSASNAESTEDVFRKHDVPPMPMQSDIHSSEVTRESILSERTEGPTSPSDGRRRAEIQHVSRGSPREVLSPASTTPTRTPLGGQKRLGTHHSNHSRGDLSEHSANSDRSLREEDHHSNLAEAGFIGAGAGVAALTAQHLADRHNQYNGQEYVRHESRGLSPIQSVSSRQESETNRDSFHHKPSSVSLNSRKAQRKNHSSSSIKSVSSAASINIARSNRPKGINLESGEEVLDQHALRELRDSQTTEGELSDRDPEVDEWLEREHEKNNRYRNSGEDSSFKDSTVDYKHMTNYTDDSLDAPYLDRVTAARELQGIGAGRNPDYRSTPVAVESAVASLHDSSVLSAYSKNREKVYGETQQQDLTEIPTEGESADKTLGSTERLHDSPGKTSLEKSYQYEQHSPNDSPRQSIARSVDEHEEHIQMGASGLPVANDPLPEVGHGIHSDSDISTNPSIIQGPMGGYQSGSQDHWPSQPTPPQTKSEFISRSKDSSAHESLKAAAAGFLTTAAVAGRDHGESKSQDLSMKDGYQSKVEDYETGIDQNFSPIRDSYMSQSIHSPPRDEGYISGPQRGPASPGISFKNAKSFNDGGMDGLMEDDDPFISQGHARHFSTNSQGLAHGMGSPLYDGATGRGIDRIESKDIVALMDHLTVRDAQRNARDTEILVTLVRSAAEMRNSFEEMKKFIAEQDDILVEAGNKQHDRTIQKIILGGPRPQPLGTPRFPRRSSTDDDGDDSPLKRRNVFRRALKGLSGRNQNDITKIEEMLIHLLGEVEGLKGTQDIRPSAGGTKADSLSSYNNLRAAGPDGYEPEGQAGTSSTGHSGYFSNPPSGRASAMRSNEGRRGSANRVSTVLEGDEELETHEQNVLDRDFEKNEPLLTPAKDTPQAGSVPMDTPPQNQAPIGTQSNEHTPKMGTDKSRKHKSSSSSFFPKVSRWSKTTASSFGENFRNSGRRERPFSEASRSGSELQQYETNDHYDPTGDDRLRSNEAMDDEEIEQENRPPSPLIPSQVSDDPKYQAHRNSLLLQHPQPRPGPTHRYQYQLESQAQNYGSRSPISPTSDTFGSDPALARYIPGAGKRYSGTAGNLSPISDAGLSETSTNPPRPPKVKDDGPLVPGPSRPPKIATKDNRPTFASPLSSEHLHPEQRYSTGSAGYDSAKDSPRSASGATPSRKPTGPRPLTSSGSYSPEKDLQRKRYRGSPNQIPSPAQEAAC